ncbi:MAG: trypsin-like peptidase domain-containing protein [Planctomycetaceae bacterium]|nr:trypsin-like peptidase domain-containing protein [Planctomycetaceae bacterium]
MERNALLFLCLCLTFPAFAQDGDRQRDEIHVVAEHFEQLGKLFRQSVERAAPTVVHISVTPNRPAGRGTRSPKIPAEESGSGIIVAIAQKNVVLTNRHVIEEADQNSIQIITHNRRILTPTKITVNEDFDLAVIEVAEKLTNPAPLGNSDEVRVSDIVFAIGNPFGLDRSVSMGIISALERRRVPGTTGAIPRVGFFQTDAAVNPGSSGGMLINLRGEVIGILTAIATQGGKNEGVAFVMPINPVLRIAEQLVKNGTAIKPYMGFAPEAMTSEDRRRLSLDRLVGARVKNVAPDTPAEQAGLKPGDVVLTFDNTEVEDDSHVLYLVAQSEIDKPIVLRINRNGEMLDVTVTPAAQLSR